MKTIRTYLDPMQANFDKGLLESNGISVHLENEHTIAVNPLYSHAVGGIELQVEFKDREKAIEIIGADHSDLKEINKLTQDINSLFLRTFMIALLTATIYLAFYNFESLYFFNGVTVFVLSGFFAFVIQVLLNKRKQ